MRRYAIILPLFLCISCTTQQPTTTTSMSNPVEFEKLTDDLLYGALALSPVSATQAGYHEHNGVPLDEMLDDYSANGIEAQRKFYEGFQSRVGALNAASLDKEQQADLEIMRNYLNLALLDLNTIQAFKHNPTVYVELVGNALFVPSVLEYAPKEQRFRAIVKRLERTPALVAQAKANLVDAPEVWNRVAREENAGNIDLIDHELRAQVPDDLKGDYDRAATGAIAALKDFSTFLETDLSKRKSDWRLGKENYAKKFAYVLVTGKKPEELLAEAEADLKMI